jgi:recombination protein RecR
MLEYTRVLAELIDEFNKYTGVGPKSAQRMAFDLLKKNSEQFNKMISVMRKAKEQIKYCNECFNLTTLDICEVCSNPNRDDALICIVEEAKDLVAIEKTREFKGKFHVLGGVISPLDGITSSDLNIAALENRLMRLLSENDDLNIELIMAINPSTEGEATMLYLKRSADKVLKEFPGRLSVTRLAYGLPVGADLDYTDEVTIIKALEARVSV